MKFKGHKIQQFLSKIKKFNIKLLMKPSGPVIGVDSYKKLQNNKKTGKAQKFTNILRNY